MARSERSLAITGTYQQRLLELQRRVTELVAGDWRQIVNPADLAVTHPAWRQRAAAVLAAAQAAGVRLTAAYVAAFLASELERPVSPPAIDETSYAGVARTGRPLIDALDASMFTVQQALAVGLKAQDASHQGLSQALRVAASETLAPPRAALHDVIAGHDEITGWRRVTSGGCGACIAAAAHPYTKHEPMRVHDHCKCTAEPVVRDIPDVVPRPDGHQIFDAMTPSEQDDLLGQDKAQLIRSGAVPLTALIATSPMAAIDDQITEAPLKALQALAA